MEDTLDYAIKLFCDMLPYIDTSSLNHLDDKRLCKMAYKAYQSAIDTDIIKSKLIEELRRNDSLTKYSDEILKEFTDNCISRIRQVQEIMNILKEFGALK